MAKTNPGGLKKTIRKKFRQKAKRQIHQPDPDILLSSVPPKQMYRQNHNHFPACLVGADAPIIILEDTDAPIIINEDTPNRKLKPNPKTKPQSPKPSAATTMATDPAYWSRVNATIHKGSTKERKVLVIGADPLYIYGSFRVQCVFGTARINGVLLEAGNVEGDRWDDACFPYNMEMPGIIENVGSNHTPKSANTQRLRWRLENFAADPKEVATKYSSGDAVVLIEGRLDVHTFSAFCQCVGYYSIVPVISSIGKIVTSYAFSKRQLRPLYTGNVDDVIKQWDNYTANTSNSGSQQVTAVIGNKGVGKSALVRYLANLKRNSHPDHVYVMDLDMGQPLFSPPGCIGLYKVEFALLGASFAMQQNDLENALYIGAIEMSKIEISDYARHISHLLKAFRGLGAGHHLIVNTAGWVEDFGAEYINTIMDVIQPDFTFNMKSYKFGNYTVRDDDRNRPGSCIFEPIVHRNLGDLFDDNRLPPISASQSRALQCTAYMMALGNTFATMRPYQVGFSRVTLHLSMGTMRLSDNMYLAAFNQVFVALCVAKQNCHRRIMGNENMPFRTIGEGEQPAELLRCIGYGVIRAIDIEKRLFYVLTPVSMKKLKEVNVFARCEDINLSQKFMTCQVNHDAPYWIWTKAHVGRTRSQQDCDVMSHLYNKVDFVTMKKRYFRHTNRAELDD